METLQHPVVGPDEWIAARRALLAQEKQLTRAQEAVAAARRALPWQAVTADYRFTGPQGEVTLAELFGDRSQLIVNHFMFGPGWGEGCIGCSFGADHIDGTLPHLAQRDVAYVAVSRAPYAELAAYKRRMGWRFDWVSSADSAFNYDMGVSFHPADIEAGRATYNFAPLPFAIEDLQGHSVFIRTADGIFRTYASYARGGEALLTTYALLDMTPKGRAENGPHHNLMDWVKRHDDYGAEPSSCCHAPAP
jgi:predicted dithiol-disulfide oxidoreductase (DUF899 family)